MESISIFDIYKIGVGPSSSHTLGPWKAAADFATSLNEIPFDKVKVTLYGSLSKTGKGHATDKAVVLGLLGYDAETIDTTVIDGILTSVRKTALIDIGDVTIHFDLKSHIVFSQEERPEHPNTMLFQAYLDNTLVSSEVYFSIGGGFIEKQDEEVDQEWKTLPHPIQSAKELMSYVDRYDRSIATIVKANEVSLRSDTEVEANVKQIFDTMKDCVLRGCLQDGVLPGGLNVKRRARGICSSLLAGASFSSFKELETLIRSSDPDFQAINRWISCFALAVNEENAAMGRVVTSPTNGAAGVVPAVLLYYYFFCDKIVEDDINRFFYTSGEIGSLFKKGATVSAAVGGCQAEIGVSSAMAAGGLTEVLGGTPRQVLMAAEIAMEHHLGLTCDPIGGLVQVPCIERNAMGAMKAITAAHLALSSDPFHSKVDLDTVIKTMWDTALDMNKKFKETSEGGLAFNIPVITPEC